MVNRTAGGLFGTAAELQALGDTVVLAWPEGENCVSSTKQTSKISSCQFNASKIGLLPLS